MPQMIQRCIIGQSYNVIGSDGGINLRRANNGHSLAVIILSYDSTCCNKFALPDMLPHNYTYNAIGSPLWTHLNYNGGAAS